MIAVLFFTLVAFAAWTSAISLVEPTIAWVVENTQVKRTHATLALGIGVWLLGIAVALSFSVWKSITIIFGLGIFDTLDKLTSTIMLPLGGLMMAVFAGYIMRKEHLQDELNLKAGPYQIWTITNNYIAPIAIFAVFVYLLGLVG